MRGAPAGSHGERMLTVVVADDDFAVLEVLAMALEGEGYRVRRAADADRLRRALQEPCDVVICSDAMLDGDVSDTLRADPGRTVIMTVERSGPIRAPDDTRHVLAKPIVLGLLFELVARARRQL